jgi:hypothetical protein
MLSYGVRAQERPPNYQLVAAWSAFLLFVGAGAFVLGAPVLGTDLCREKRSLPISRSMRRLCPFAMAAALRAWSAIAEVTPLHLPVYRLRDLFRRFHNVVNSAPWQDDARKRAITIGAPFIATGCVRPTRCGKKKCPFRNR